MEAESLHALFLRRSWAIGQEQEISDLSATILLREEGDKINIPLEVDNKFIFHHNV